MFDYRGPSDWQEDPATYERIATVAIDYWSEHGKPPMHDIADIMETDEEALGVLLRLETIWARETGLEEKKAKVIKPGRPIVYNDEDDDDVDPDQLVKHWIDILTNRIESYHRTVQNQQHEKKEEKAATAPQKPLSNRDAARALAKDGKTQTEIAQELNISQPAVSKMMRRRRRLRQK